MAIFSPFLVLNPSVIADSACPIIFASLSPPTIAVAVDFVISVFVFVSLSLSLDQNSLRFIGRVTAERLMRSRWL